MERKMFLGASNHIFENAKTLRSKMTPCELILWAYLKQKPFGYKFRRQHPISSFIADFYCHALKLIIEIDGSIHDKEINKKYDSERQKYLETYEIEFLRFTNAKVEKELSEVIKSIENFINNKKTVVIPV